MESNQPESTIGPCVAVPESAWHPDLDPMLLAWPLLAAVAWQGFCDHGRGIVYVTIKAVGAEVSYRTPPPLLSGCDTLTTYDPEREVVVVVERDEEVNVYVVDGWPPPPALCAMAPAEVFGLTVH